MDNQLIIYIALGIAFLVPVIFLGLIRTFDLYGTGKQWVYIVVMGWGIVTYFMAAKINPAMMDSAAVIAFANKFNMTSYDFVIRISGPVLEELLKAAILIYLVQRADFNYVVDGALYGFGAGIGFAIIENYEYVVGHSEAALMVAIARVFSTNLVHATGSGIIGTALAYHRGDASWRGWAIPFAGYGVSMFLHVMFNTMVNSGVTPLIAAIGYGVLGVAFIWYIIKRGMTVQKEWVGEKLGMGDRVTSNEMKMVRNVDIIDDALEPIRARFGEEKADIVRKFLMMQAEIGIKRKLMDTTPSESKKKEIEEIVNNLSKEMDLLRKQVGYLCMMQVRMVYLEQDFKFYELLDTRVTVTPEGQAKSMNRGLFGTAKKVSGKENESQQEDKS